MPDVEVGLPRIPGVQDHAAYLRFLDNRKAFDAYHKQLVDQYERLTKAIALHGKAKQIEKLHAEAQALKDSVLSDIEVRERALKAGQEALVKKTADDRKKVADEQKRATERANAKQQEADEAWQEAEAAKKAATAALSQAQAEQKRAETHRKANEKLRAELKEKVDRARAIEKAVA